MFDFKVSRDDHSKVVEMPGQDDQSMSPTLIRHNNNPPAFLTHPESCQCFPCSLPGLHSTILELFFDQSWSLMLEKDISEAKAVFAVAIDMFPAVLNKAKHALKGLNSLPDLEDELSYKFLGCLLQSGECLSWHHLWSDLDILDTKIRNVVGSISKDFLESNPAHLVWYEELRSSVVYFRDNQDRIERSMEAMMKGMSLLSVSEEDQTKAVTPECTSSRQSRVGRFTFLHAHQKFTFHLIITGAPKKAVVSSLGVGEPDNLAKNLEDILNLVPEGEGNHDDKPDVKTPPPVVKKARKPRLIDDVILKSARTVPKLQVEGETATPNKFFKSRNKAQVESSPAPEGFKTPSVAPASTSRKPSRVIRPGAKASSSDVYSLIDENIGPVKNLKASGLLSQKIEIFDDSQLKTPVKSVPKSESSSTRKIGSRSSRKVTPSENTEDVFTTPAPASSRKTSLRTTSTRKTKEVTGTTEENETPAPSSSRRSARKTKTEETTETPSTATRSSTRRVLRRL